MVRVLRVRCYCSKFAKSHQVTPAIYRRHQERELALEALISDAAANPSSARAPDHLDQQDTDQEPPSAASYGIAADQEEGDVITATELALEEQGSYIGNDSDADSDLNNDDIYEEDFLVQSFLDAESLDGDQADFLDLDYDRPRSAAADSDSDSCSSVALSSGSGRNYDQDSSDVESEDAYEVLDEALNQRISDAELGSRYEVADSIRTQILPGDELDYLANQEYRVDAVLLQSIYMLQWKNASRTPDKWFRILLRLAVFRQTPMSAERARRRVQRLVHFQPIVIDCCADSCMLFFGPDAERDTCKCGLPRYKTVRIKGKPVQRPVKVFMYIPLIPRLQLQYANSERAYTLQSYPASLEMDSTPGEMRDFWDADHFRKLHDKDGLFTDSRDLALQLSADGVAIVRQKNFSVWPVILLNYNLPPRERVKARNIILVGIIPGPHHPRDIDSFLEPLIQEMALLRRGVTAYDAYHEQLFQLKAHIVSVSGDTPAIAMMMRMKGSNARLPCRFCFLQGEYCTEARHMYYPHYAEFLIVLKPRSSMLRDMYRVAAADNEELRKATGYNGIPGLIRLRHSINFPYSFGQDPMHLLSNVCALMFSHWTVSSMPKPEFEDEEHCYVLSNRTWEEIGEEQVNCRRVISSSLARTPRSIWTHHRSYKAKEWESWLFLFSVPLLVGRLPDYCLQHWKLLKDAFSLLYQTQISRAEAQEARKLLIDFVLQYEAIYFQQEKSRLKACTSQIHALLHIVDSVTWLGPVFCFWQFPLERYVGAMERLATSKSEINTSLTNNLIHRERINYLLLSSKNSNPQGFATPFWEEEAELGYEAGYYCPLDESHTRVLVGKPLETDTSPRLRRCLQSYINCMLPDDHLVALLSRMLLDQKVTIGSRLQSGRDTDRMKHLVELEIVERNTRGRGGAVTTRRYAAVQEFVTFLREPGQQDPVEHCALVQFLEIHYVEEVGLSYIRKVGDYCCVPVFSIIRTVGIVSRNARHLHRGGWSLQAQVTAFNARWIVALANGSS